MRARNTAIVAVSMLVVGAAVEISGCSDGAPPASTATPKVVRDDAYPDILGVIEALPVPGQPETTLRIHHQHIPGFKTRENVVNVSPDGIPGMKSMVMPFPPAQGVSLDGLEVGDKVRFSFAVHWGGNPPWEVTKIERLDPSTEIDFTNAPAPTDDATEDQAEHADHADHGEP